MSAIVISDLSKKVGREYVLDHLNLEILDGEFFSILGLSQSGKSTLARILLNFLKPGSGSATIFDMDIKKDSKSIKEFCSFVSQDVWMFDQMRPEGIFKKVMSFHNTKNKEELQELKEYFGFRARKKFGDLSMEDKKITAFIAALMVKPKLIILDEPAEGVSAEVSEKLFARLKELQKTENLTVLLLTNSLPVAQRYSDRAAYLHGGVIKNVEYLKEKTNRDKILKIFGQPIAEGAFDDIGGKVVSQGADVVTVYYDGELQKLSQKIVDLKLYNYNLEDATLKDKIEAYYEGGSAQ